MNFYKKCTAKPYSFSFNDAAFVPDNLSPFRKNLLERILKLIMTIDSKTREEKLPYDISRKAAKTSALSSVNIDKYEYCTGKEILPSERKVIEQAKFTYSPLGKL